MFTEQGKSKKYRTYALYKRIILCINVEAPYLRHRKEK